jgi:hypothetical protein
MKTSALVEGALTLMKEGHALYVKGRPSAF